MDKKSIAFLDTDNTVNEDGKVEVDVYRKATQTSKYLDFHSHSPAQSKRNVVKILLDRAKCIPSTTARRRSEERRVINDLKAFRELDTPGKVKPRPNDRNMPTQHIATLLLGATCCARLATLLRHVATCWVLLAQI